MNAATPAETIQQRLQAHLEAEVALDVDATMATMSANPIWECVPLNFRATGADAVRELYNRVIANYIPRLKNFEELTTSIGENQAVVEHMFTMEMPDGSTATGHHLAVALMEDGEMVGERVYFDSRVEKLFRWALGEDFVSIPGVTPLIER
jgi:carboxymethylenebutenolidase